MRIGVPSLLPALMALLILLGGCGGLPKNYVVLLKDPDGTTGAVTVTNPSGSRVLDKAGFATGMDKKEEPPSEPFPMAEEEIRKVFGKALDASPEPPISFILYFKLDKTDLTPDSEKELPEIISAISQRKVPNISVIGHTDRSGDEEYNYRLALRRAEAIRDILVRAGLDPKTIEVTSHGENNPLVETADGVIEIRNRRVEVTVR
jgi:outer membrane protein OmpA-like peptidoglycan-associated protein